MDGTLTKLIIFCKVGICLVRCLNLKHRQTVWRVSSETTGDIIKTKNVKKQEAVFSFEMHWSSIASKTQELDLHLSPYQINSILVW